MAATAYSLPTASGDVTFGTSSGIAGKPFTVMGLALIETGGTSTVTVEIRTTSSSGKLLAALTAATSKAAPYLWYGPQGVRCNSGKLYMTKVGTGTVTGSVFIA